MDLYESAPPHQAAAATAAILPYTTRLRAIFQSLQSLRATVRFPNQTPAHNLGCRSIDFVWHDRAFPNIHSMAAPPPPPKGGGLSLYANLLNPKADAQATVSGAPVVYDNGKKEDAAVKKEVNQGMQRSYPRLLARPFSESLSTRPTQTNCIPTLSLAISANTPTTNTSEESG